MLMETATARLAEQDGRRDHKVVSRGGHTSKSSTKVVNKFVKKRKYCSSSCSCRKSNRKNNVSHFDSDSVAPMAKPSSSSVPISQLQQLFASCGEAFKGPGTVPLPHDVHNLSRILDNMRPEDVGLSRDLHFFKPKTEVKGTPRVTYTTIYECNNFSLCCFFIPATGVIPLHNHPGMTVFSKLLLGKMHIKSYDWVDPVSPDDSAPAPKLRLAKLKADTVFTAPCNTSVLYPTEGGNIHALTAITPCAVLDVIGPPYSHKDGRDSAYYKDNPYTANSNGGEAAVTEEKSDCYGWLEEIEMPESSEMDRIEYLGPQVN